LSRGSVKNKYVYNGAKEFNSKDNRFIKGKD
jgi:hypothetical protein